MNAEVGWVVPDRPVQVDEHGMARIGDWEIFTAVASFEPCPVKVDHPSAQAGRVCMAMPNHEHPHMPCNPIHPYWVHHRITGVRRRALVS